VSDLPWADRAFIIAEAGVNHNGSVELAQRLIDAAAEAGADAVKFQVCRTEDLVVRDAPSAEYQKRHTKSSQFNMLKALELSESEHTELQRYAATNGILYFATAFDLNSVRFLGTLEIPLWKIPSGEITNLPYLRAIAALNRPTILSTGMATLADVDAAVRALGEAGLDLDRLVVLHCTSEYPAPFADVNLRAMPAMGAALGCRYGYSDHTVGIEVASAAVALGACVVEKHFTLDRSFEGPDHQASIEPSELQAMVRWIRHVETALGAESKRPQRSELANRDVVRKSIVAAKAIACGEMLTNENLTAKRPAGGISPMEWDRVIGRLASRDYAADEAIEW